MKLFTAAEMKEIDRVAIEERGIPSDVLMERAARHLANEVLALSVEEKSAVVFCGSGNNGGDGVAAARFLQQAGWRVRCVLVGKREKMTADCAEMERRLLAAGGAPEAFESSADYGGFSVAVDALFGILETTDLRSFTQLRTDWQKTLPAVARQVRHLDPETRELLFRALKELAKFSLKTLPETIKKEG